MSALFGRISFFSFPFDILTAIVPDEKNAGNYSNCQRIQRSEFDGMLAQKRSRAYVLIHKFFVLLEVIDIHSIISPRGVDHFPAVETYPYMGDLPVTVFLSKEEQVAGFER